MIAVVVAESSQSSACIEHAVQVLSQAGIGTIAIASRNQISPLENVGLISFSERFSLGVAISEYLRSQAATPQVMLIDAAASNLPEFSSALESMKQSATSGVLMYLSTQQNGSSLEFPGMSEGQFLPELFIQQVQAITSVPGIAAVVPLGLLVESKTSSQSLGGLMLELVIEGYARGDEIRASDRELTIATSDRSMVLPKGDLSCAIRKALEVINIEELFPRQPWKTSEQASAAACYHALAAKLIRVEDFRSAEECLSQAERFAEDPRSMALRAVIAMERGQTFGAIAKLIASLQDYESLKRSNDRRISTTGPQNFELVNQALKQGLEALNAKDNSSALKHFARAVAEFDCFYRDSGLLL